MNGIKHELVGSAAAAAAAAAAYPNPLLYGPAPSWMTGENFAGTFIAAHRQCFSFFTFIKTFACVLSVERILLDRARARRRCSLRHQTDVQRLRDF